MGQFCDIDSRVSPAVISLHGKWRLPHMREQLLDLQRIPYGQRSIILDGTQLEELDTASSMTLLRELYRVGYAPTQLGISNFKPHHKAIFDLTLKAVASPVPLRTVNPLAFLGQIGKDSIEIAKLALDIVTFTGATMFELCRATLDHRHLRHRELSVQLEAVGLRAIPIIALVTFLIGIVIAYLTGVQIEKYGANIFIVDAVAIAMCRELSPILVAIIVAGRSGSAFTAQLGTMKLNEEIDAMQTMGLSPMRVLVLPRLMALVIAMPLLVFVGDISGILGGMLIADTQLGVTGATFIERLSTQLVPKTVLVGLIKAPIFGFFIACIGCRLGLETENNARSLGINTTKTVVRSIVSVILLNAAFAIIFNELGI